MYVCMYSTAPVDIHVVLILVVYNTVLAGTRKCVLAGGDDFAEFEKN